MQAASRLRFGDFALDVASQQLLRDGREVALTPKAFRVLTLLAQNDGQVVTKERLLDEVWADTFVLDAVVKVCVAEVRRALGERASEPRHLHTVQRRGYRFEGPVRIETAKAARLPAPQTCRRCGAAMIADAAFCSSCGGRRMAGLTSEAAVAPASRAAPTRGVQSRLDHVDATELTPMVGRDQEISLILDRWQSAQEGHGKGLLVSGEAGMGKSRLVHALHERIVPDESHCWMELRGSAFHRHSALHPVIELLRQAFDLSSEHSREEQLVDLTRGLEQTGLAPDDILPFFAPLLALPVPVDRPMPSLSPEMHRRRTLETLCAWMLVLAEQQPLVLVAEDLHWADPSTVEFLEMLVDQISIVPALLVVTCRPEEEPEWRGRSHMAVLPLDALTGKQVDAMVENIAGGKRVPRALREHVRARTDGVPLFVEELVKSALESGLFEESDGGWERTDPLPNLAVPDTLHGSLEARLDRLGAAKAVAQLAAALGREFPQHWLETVSGVASGKLDDRLSELVDAGLLHRRGMSPKAAYSFKHALIHETAYASIPEGVRVEYHTRIARSLEDGLASRLSMGPESIARHYAEAGRLDEAIAAYETAGRRANARSAHSEAIAHYRSALALLERVPRDTDRNLWEIELQVGLGEALVPSLGSGSAEAEVAYSRAHGLARTLGVNAGIVDALDGLVTFYITQGRLEPALDLARQQLEVVQQIDEPELQLRPYLSLAIIEYFRGNPARSLEHYDQVQTCFDPVAHRSLATIRGENIGSVSLAWSSWAHWISGRPEQAVETAEAGIARARDVGHPWSLAFCLAWASTVYAWSWKLPEAFRTADEGIELAEAQGFPVPLGVARLIRSLSATSDAGPDEPLAAAERVVDEFRATGTGVAMPQIIGSFASFCLARGRPDRAAEYIESAFALAEETGQPFWNAELLGIRGDLVLARDPANVDEAEAIYRSSLATAAAQGALMLELRAATRLCRLLGDGASGDAARSLLADVHGRFEEGVDLPELVIAKRLFESGGSVLV